MNHSPVLYDALRYVAARCDGAAEEDGMGFNGTDTHFGKALAATPPSAWSDGNARHAWEILRKYRKQLAGGGIDYDSIPEPPQTNSDSAIRVVDHNPDHGVIVRVPYGDRANVKYDLSARWDRDARCWVIPSRRWVDVLPYAERESLGVSSEARERLEAALSGDTPTEAPFGTVDAVDGRFTLRFEYDPAAVAAVRDIPGRAWNASEKQWVAPVSSVRAVRAFAERFYLQLTEAAEAVDDAEPLSGPVVEVAGGVFLLRFDYDRDLIARVKDLPGARWQASQRAWAVDLEATLEVSDFVVATEAALSNGAAKALAGARDALERIEASAAKDAELVIPGLGGDLLPFQRAGVAYALRAMGFAQGDDGSWSA